MHRSLHIVTASLLCLLMIGPAFATVARAGGVSTIDFSKIYTFTDATGGLCNGDSALTHSRYSVDTKTAQGYSSCIFVSLGASGWAQVWKTVQASDEGNYYAWMTGQYKCTIVAAGLAEADVWFYMRIWDLSTGLIASNYLIKYFAAGIIGGGTYQGVFDVTLAWYADRTHQYGLGVYVKAFTGGSGGSSIADAIASGNGIWFTQVTVWHSSGGGGGCVAKGMEIALADGSFVPVEELKKGQSVLAYDTEAGSVIVEQVYSVKRSVVNTLEIINNGALIVTLVDQPVYIRHDNFTGWVVNPVDLVVGWEMFCPLGNSWITITSISFETGKFIVYEIEASAPHTFIAEGILLHNKKK